jgi:hypothetical protein
MTSHKKSGGISLTAVELAEPCERFLAACQSAKSLSPNTLSAYRQDLQVFRSYRSGRGTDDPLYPGLTISNSASTTA